MARPTDAKLAELTERRVCVFSLHHCCQFVQFSYASHVGLQRKKQQQRALRALHSREYRARKQQVKCRERLGRAVAQLLSATSNARVPSGKELIDSSSHRDLIVKRTVKIGGVGVWTAAFFKCGQVLVRYAGETLSLEEGNTREAARRKGLCWHAACNLNVDV